MDTKTTFRQKMGKIAHIECMVEEAIWATPESSMILLVRPSIRRLPFTCVCVSLSDSDIGADGINLRESVYT